MPRQSLQSKLMQAVRTGKKLSPALRKLQLRNAAKARRAKKRR